MIGFIEDASNRQIYRWKRLREEKRNLVLNVDSICVL